MLRPYYKIKAIYFLHKRPYQKPQTANKKEELHFFKAPFSYQILEITTSSQNGYATNDMNVKVMHKTLVNLTVFVGFFKQVSNEYTIVSVADGSKRGSQLLKGYGSIAVLVEVVETPPNFYRTQKVVASITRQKKKPWMVCGLHSE